MTNATAPPLLVSPVHHAGRCPSPPSAAASFFRCLLLMFITYAFVEVVIMFFPYPSYARWRPCINNRQLDCYAFDDSGTLGYFYSSADNLTFSSFITFRSQDNYRTPSAIGDLLNTDPAAIARLNDVDDVNSAFAIGELVVVPLECACSCIGPPRYYQHNTRCIIKYAGEFYLLLANDTSQEITPCQVLMAQNPSIGGRKLLTAGVGVNLPHRCASPQRVRRAAGVKHLLSNLTTWSGSIAVRFDVPAELELEANSLAAADDAIYTLTNVLVPLFDDPLSSRRVRTLARLYVAPVDVARTKGS